MSDRRVTLQRADDETIASVAALLAANGLPTADVESGTCRFYVAVDDGERVGTGGLEPFESAGLLRSVAVEEEHRGRGYGSAICAGIEAEARDAGLDELYLLTTTAAEFFADRGYETVERADAPPPVRETTEFADLCPASATCMRTSL